MENTKRIGNLTELACITRLYEIGCSVSIPFGNSEKYDVIIDCKDKLYKIQIKHAQEHINEEGLIDYILIRCEWQGHNINGYKKYRYQANEIDYFATFYDNECYLIPQKECSSIKQLRIIPPKNNQKKGITFLKNQKASEVLAQL
jgi:hypothetical protein